MNQRSEPRLGVSQDAALGEGEGHTNGSTAVRCQRVIEPSIIDRFEQQVANYPDRIAVKTRSQSFTYNTLNKMTNRVARAIFARRGDYSEPVAVLLEQGAAVIASMLGVLKAGKVDVPLDPVNPVARIREILTDSQAGLVVTDSRSLALAKELAGDKLGLLNVDELDESLEPENLGLPIPPDSAARIIYTSGSTGQPKGVVLTHRRIVRQIINIASSCTVGPNDRLALITTPSTSQGTMIAYTALLNGAGLYLFNVRKEGIANLVAWIEGEEITVYTSVPAIFRLITSVLTDKQELSKLRVIALGGDQVRKRDVELYQKHFSHHSVLKIFFSSTEAGTLCEYSIGKNIQITNDIVPIGYPVDGMEILLLDDKGNEVGFNHSGEIAVKSRYLSAGYWRMPDLTQSKFRPDVEGGDECTYLSGDLGRRLSDGCLEYLGRKDSRVKIRGYAVEVAEIEAALIEDDRVSEAVVGATESPGHDPLLVAYVVPRTRSGLAAGELGKLLRGKLPDYMMPSDFVVLDALPLTPMGKIDRQALFPPRQSVSGRSQSLLPPQNKAENTIIGIWKKVLQLDMVGTDDNFFDLGGNSLRLIEAQAQLIKIFGVHLSITDLLKYPTVNSLANYLAGDENQETVSSEQDRVGRLKAGQAQLKRQSRTRREKI